MTCNDPSMDYSDKPETLPPAPTYPHRPLFPYHHHFNLSPHCPHHGGYLLHPNTHLHHHLHLSANCPLHRHLLPHCPLHTSFFHSNHQSTTNFTISPNFSSFPNPNFNKFNFIPPEADPTSKSETLNEDDEDEDEFIFVLTDEWKDFFAKSEAKRRLAKKQAKKKSKN